MARSQAALAPVGAALALIGQAIAFTASFQGHPWQIDSHMMFFALLACLVSLRSIPALLTATVVIALHHLSLSFIMPSLIYPGGDFTGNLGRTVLHAVIVVMEAAALIATVHRLHRLNHRMAQQTSDLEDSLQQADQARQDAQAAGIAAEEARAEAHAAKEKAETALVQAKQADEERKAAEAQKQQLDAQRLQEAEATRKEQAEVVNALRAALTRLEGGDLTTRITRS